VTRLFAIPAAVAALAFVGPPGHPEVNVGGFPTGITLNRETGTIYVGNGTTGTVSVIDGRTCNARHRRGCGRRRNAVTAGTDPIGIAVDEATNTVYVANASGTVAVVDGRRCDSANVSGCQAAVATIRVGSNPQFLAVDERTHTVYVANSGSNTLSVIDARSQRVRATVHVGPAPFTVAVNDATRSVYVSDLGAHTVSVIDARRCSALVVTGCARRPVDVNVGETPGGIAVNARTDTIYVTGEVTNDVSVIDGRTCNARVTTGCRRLPVHVRAGLGARGIAVDEATDTVYVANTADNTVSVIDGSRCNAAIHAGCGRPPAVAGVGLSPRRVAVDEKTSTVYVTNAGSDTVTMLDGRTCNGRVHSGC
jgi:YVTN family beta-propeller protein